MCGWCTKTSGTSSTTTRLDLEWAAVGAEVHAGETVDGGASCELQGGRLHSSRHTVGLAPLKMANIMQSTWWLLARWCPATSAVERIVGNIGYGHCFCPHRRAAYSQIFKALETHLEEGREQFDMTVELWWELMSASILLPL